jgi:hypothetical protein
VSDSCIDPSHGIGDIGAINGNFISDKEILGDIFLHPFAKSNFFFNRPSTVSHLPNLERGFLERLTERGGGEEEKKQ